MSGTAQFSDLIFVYVVYVAVCSVIQDGWLAPISEGPVDVTLLCQLKVDSCDPSAPEDHLRCLVVTKLVVLNCDWLLSSIGPA